MNKSEAFEAYYAAVHDVSRERAVDLVNSLLDNGVDAETIVFDVISPSLEKLVQAFMEKKVILSQHFVATKISDEIIDSLMPRFKQTTEKQIKVVIGCAMGDFHGLGKKIVTGSLKANRIETIDLGLNVSPETFVNEAVKNKAHVIGVSSMMVHTALGESGPKKVRRILVEQNLNEKIRLIVGGAPYKFDKNMYREAGADDWAGNGMEAVNKIVNLYKTL